jgi:hypothetical protein
MSRLARIVAALLFAGVTTVVVAPAPAFAAACAGVSGVTVVVDFASLGGGVTVACAPSDPTSGIAALKSAGFTAETVYNSAFVCRLNGKPTPEQDKCAVTPPVSAYWSFWHAKPGGTWNYSSLGADSYDPGPGTVEGWAFGAGKPPSIAPPALVTRPAPTTPAPKATTRPAPPSAASTPPPATSTSTVQTTTPSPSPTTPAMTGSEAPPPSYPPDPPVGTIAGIAVVAVVAGTAGLSVWRRRRSAARDDNGEALGRVSS